MIKEDSNQLINSLDEICMLKYSLYVFNKKVPNPKDAPFEKTQNLWNLLNEMEKVLFINELPDYNYLEEIEGDFNDDFLLFPKLISSTIDQYNFACKSVNVFTKEVLKRIELFPNNKHFQSKLGKQEVFVFIFLFQK